MQEGLSSALDHGGLVLLRRNIPVTKQLDLLKLPEQLIPPRLWLEQMFPIFSYFSPFADLIRLIYHKPLKFCKFFVLRAKQNKKMSPKNNQIFPKQKNAGLECLRFLFSIV